MIKQDNDGHRYNLRKEQEARFDEIMDMICSAKFGSDEWYDANDLLNDEFGDRMRG